MADAQLTGAEKKVRAGPSASRGGSCRSKFGSKQIIGKKPFLKRSLTPPQEEGGASSLGKVKGRLSRILGLGSHAEWGGLYGLKHPSRSSISKGRELRQPSMLLSLSVHVEILRCPPSVSGS